MRAGNGRHFYKCLLLVCDTSFFFLSKYDKLRLRSRLSLTHLYDYLFLKVEAQKNVFVEVGVSRAVGNASLQSLHDDYSDDAEGTFFFQRSLFVILWGVVSCAFFWGQVLSIIKDFSVECSEAWIAAVRAARPAKLQKTGRMNRDQILSFIDACGTLFSVPSTRDEMRREFLSKSGSRDPLKDGRAAAAAKSVAWQRGLLECIGVEASFGVSCLNRIGQV
jgi:hypothetical protein